MNVRLLISLSLVAAVGLAGAYGLGLFDSPARPAASAGLPADEAPAAPTTPPAGAAAERSSGRPADVPEIRTPLPPAPTTGTLRIDSDVRGADVFVDNAFVGRTPVVIEGVAPGRRKINVSAEGYDTAGGFHDIAAGPSELTIPVRVIRLDRRVAVRHRHGVGGCEGVLSASPEGLRYETAHADHAFRATLTALQTFSADYLEKNLEVVTGGRRYNFTVAGGATVDDLYGFYQDVEKVRRRLADGGNDE